MRSVDPTRMTTDEILTELGELLAAGFQRRIASSTRHPAPGEHLHEALDVDGDSEAQWGATTEKSR